MSNNIEYDQSMDERLKHLTIEIIQPNDVDIFLLCGGKGSRLKNSDHEEFKKTPKPLVKINTSRGNLRMIDNAILGITEAGFTNLTLLTGSGIDTHGSEIEEYSESRYKNLNLGYSRENTPLGTAGATYEAFLFSRKDNAIITPIDTLFPFNKLPLIVSSFHENDTGLTLVVTSTAGENAQNIGRIKINKSYITRTLEGDTLSSESKENEIPVTSTGVVIASKIYFIEMYRSFITQTNMEGAVDLYRNLIPWLLQKGEKVGYYDVCEPTPDLGTPDRLFQFGR